MYEMGNYPHKFIRPYRDTDKAVVVGVWYRSGLSTYTYLPTWQALTLETATWVFENIIQPKCNIWVGTLDEYIVVYMAMSSSYMDRLYIDPSEWRKGWGTRFIKLAKYLHPQGLNAILIKRTTRRGLCTSEMVSLQ